MAEHKNQVWRIVTSLLSIVSIVVFLPICACLTASWIVNPTTDLKSRFRLFSDIQLPPSAHVILADDGERAPNGDGVFSVVFEVNDVDLNALLQSAPFGVSWEAGPVPLVIVKSYYENEFKRKAPWSATNVLYTAQNRGPKDMPWHNGRVFIVERDSNRVWFGEWDY